MARLRYRRQGRHAWTGSRPFSSYVPDRLNLRLSGNYLNYSYDGTADDIDYEFTLDFKTATLLADWIHSQTTSGSARVSYGTTAK